MSDYNLVSDAPLGGMDKEENELDYALKILHHDAPISRFKQLFAEACRTCWSQGTVDDSLKYEIQFCFRNILDKVNSLIYTSNLSVDTKEALGRWVHCEFIAFSLLGTWPSRSFRKPQNIAGDHHTIRQIYDQGTQEHRAIGHVVNYCYISEPACKAVINRKNYIFNKIKKCVESTRTSVNVTSVACGPAEEIFDVYKSLEKADRFKLKAVGIDNDLRACSSVADEIKREKLRDHFDVRHADILKPNTYSARQEPQDLVYSVGLVDYFSERLCVRTVNNIYQMLKPGGEIILGNFHVQCPSRVFLDYILDWKLNYRTELDMKKIFSNSLFAGQEVVVDFEDEKVNMLVRCRKPLSCM